MEAMNSTLYNPKLKPFTMGDDSVLSQEVNDSGIKLKLDHTRRQSIGTPPRDYLISADPTHMPTLQASQISTTYNMQDNISRESRFRNPKGSIQLNPL